MKAFFLTIVIVAVAVLVIKAVAQDSEYGNHKYH